MTYTADPEHGYVADVKYTGDAVFPDGPPPLPVPTGAVGPAVGALRRRPRPGPTPGPSPTPLTAVPFVGRARPTPIRLREAKLSSGHNKLYKYSIKEKKTVKKA